MYVGYRVRGVCGDGFRELGLRMCWVWGKGRRRRVIPAPVKNPKIEPPKMVPLLHWETWGLWGGSILLKALAGLGNGMRVLKARAVRRASSLPFETWNCGKGDH